MNIKEYVGVKDSKPLMTNWTLKVKKNEAYKKLPMLNEAHEKELVRVGIDLKAIKDDIEKKPEVDAERKDESEKEDDQGKKWKKIRTRE
ncbi:uncharacterized protein A4U43_C08F28360 [Asparagus officinalis]|nr:uncharacterized protein A4U43_C08F28360 [Asparagus officinalis]